MSTRKIATLAAAALAALALAGPAQALGAPELEVSSSHKPEKVPAGTFAKYTLKVSNKGSEETTEDPIDVHFAVPAGLTISSVDSEVVFFGFKAWTCSIAGNAQSVDCSGPNIGGFFPLQTGPGQEACLGIFGVTCHIIVLVKVDSTTSPGTVTPSFEACGGGAAACFSGSDPFEVGPPPKFEVTSFDGQVLEEGGDPATEAGSHPFTAATQFSVSTAVGASGAEIPVEQLKDATVKLPPGLAGNPQAIPPCAQVQLGEEEGRGCPDASQIGFVTIRTTSGDSLGEFTWPVYNMERPGGSAAVPIGTPALLAFNALGARIEIYVKLRTGEDYGVTVINKNAPQTLQIGEVDFTFWGVPADPSHDADRGYLGMPCADKESPPSCSNPSSAPLRPFLSLPTSCVGPGPNNSLETSLELSSWSDSLVDASFLSHDNTLPTPNPIGADGCNAVDFSPTLQARPTTNVADSPSGLDVDLKVPQHENCDPGPPVSCEAAEAHLKDTTVTLPAGMVVNPSGANGLGACSEAQFGFTSKEGDVIHTTPDPATCPDAAKLGTVEVDSPVVDHPIKGNVYIAAPHANPFNSLLALYITVDDPATGVVVKLAGEVHADPNTGRLTTTVLENPQLPFEDFKLHFFGGAQGALRTPAVCGTYSTTSSLTPWSAPDSGPPATPSDLWAITQAPGGGACPTSSAARPNTPGLDAGSVSPIAASYTPTVVTLRRDDGSQEFSTVNLTLPPGMTGKLAGILACPDAALVAAAGKSGREEEAGPSCPAASRIGTVNVAAGAGPAPYNAQGIAYLTGPYKGAPLSLAIVTPATAGPFDLGTVVVRTALHLDPTTGQITADSDPIPSILQGIPLDVRSAQIKLDKPGFTRNGTSCDPSAFSGSLLSTLGQSAPLTERFQLGECTGLAFKPKLGIRLNGGTKRGSHPALVGTVRMPEGGANIAKAVVALPHSEFLDQAHIGTVCTRVQFQANECPAASVYGHAVGTSPLVDYPLEGPAILRSSSHKLPDLVIALHGPASQPVEVDVVGRIDSVKGGIRTSFEGIPDLPVSSFVLSMEGGKKGLLQNSTNICKGVHKATAEFDAQNGKVADLTPPMQAKCPKAAKHHKRHRRSGAQRAAR
jgi:hypothetical protein